MPTRGERLLAAELIGTEAIVTMRQLSKHSVPQPHQYMAGLAAYGMLSGLALVGDSQADFAAALGGLVLLTVMLSFPDLFTWIAKASGGTFPASSSTGGTSSGKSGVTGLIGRAEDLIGNGFVPIPNSISPAHQTRQWLCDHSPGIFKPLFGC